VVDFSFPEQPDVPFGKFEERFDFLDGRVDLNLICYWHQYLCQFLGVEDLDRLLKCIAHEQVSLKVKLLDLTLQVLLELGQQFLDLDYVLAERQLDLVVLLEDFVALSIIKDYVPCSAIPAASWGCWSC
jgi:hypothetical protein